jgi:endo-1,3(4)-beta-glucanase
MLLYPLLIILQVSFSVGAPLYPPPAGQEHRIDTRGREKYLQLTVVAVLPTTTDRHREGYLTIAQKTTYSTNTERYLSVPVRTTSIPGGIAQIPASPSVIKPDTTGTLVSSLETGGRPSLQPFPTDKISTPTSLIPSSGSKIATKPTATSTMAQPPTYQNIFGAPIAVNAPAAIFTVKSDHPVPRLGVSGPGPHHTNKFYGNFNLGNQNAPAYVHPYSVAWAKGQGASASWGLAISHIEANQRVYGDQSRVSGVNAVKYYLNPVGIQSLCLSAVELGKTTTLTLDNMDTQSVNVNLLDKSGGNILIKFPLVQGMAFVTAIYAGSTPVINSGVFFRQVTKSINGPKPGMTKYTMYLEDGKTWHLYAYSPAGETLDLTVVNNGLAKADKPFNGIIQVAKDPGGAEQILDSACGAYATGVTLSGSVSGSKGSYTFNYAKAGIANTKLLMFALPHHVDCFDTATYGGKTTIQLQTTTKGIATAIVGDSWTMVEPNMPVAMDFAPWDPKTGPKRTIKAQYIDTIAPIALKEISQSVDQQSDQNSMYFSGKVSLKKHVVEDISDIILGIGKVCSSMLYCARSSWEQESSPDRSEQPQVGFHSFCAQSTAISPVLRK